MYRKIYQSCLTCDKRKKHEIVTEPEIEEPSQAQEAEPEKQKETPVPPTDKIKPLTHAYAIEEDKDFEESVKNEVQRLWRDVEKQCQDSNSELQPLTEDTKTDIDWNIIRVFVSSTFTDFFNEREVLVKKVFPELREWCQGRGLKLVECDLRWGIPKDTSTAETILVCLDELERCRKTNKNRPFFINLVGERYGWIPSLKETPEEAKEKYQWVEGASITFMEVLYGAYREANPNAAFFMRNSSVCNDIPQAHISRFIDAEPVAKCHLKMLRSKLCTRFPNQVFPYNCSFKQINNTSGREQVELSDLDTFADLVLNFLKNAIEKTYPVSNIAETEVDANKQEQDLQWMFVLDKSKEFIGRQTDLQTLQEYIESGQATQVEKTVLDEDHNPDSNVRRQADWEVEDSDVSLLVLEGPSGWGKTTLLCKLIIDTVKTGSNIFYHIVGSTPTSIQVDCLLKRLLQTLLPEPTDDQKIVLNSDSIEDLQSLLKEALVSYRKKKDQKLIVIIDGASELDTSDIYKHLFWLPPSFPNNIRCIVSTDLHPPTTARLYEYPTYKMTLQSMSPEDLSTLAVRYLAQFNKRLDPTQLNKVIMNTKADNPLWVMLMTEELRVFGDFRLMDSKIDNFPDSMSDFLSQVIDRLTHEDDENEIIKKVLCLTACSKHGLPLDHILKILGNIQSKEELPPMYWAKARRALKPYLRVSGHSENLLAFAHQPVLTAVRNHLIADRMEAAQWHTTLADFYQFWCEDARTKCYHLPYHLESAMLQARLLDFLQQDPDSYFYIFPFQRSSFLKNVRCNMIASENIPSTAPIMLCHMCATATRGWNPACNWTNKSCCVVCGGLTNMGPGATPARACSRHADSKGPGKVKCVLCNFIVDINLKTGPLVPTPGQICNTCNNFGHNLCACFNV